MKCCLGLLTVDMHFEQCRSLKDRRKILTSLRERLRARFNVSVAEGDCGDKWQRGSFLISCAGSEPALVEQALRSVLAVVEDDPRVAVLGSTIRYYE